MQCYTELTPPTAVTHAVTLPFLAPRANNLVVAKTSLLQVFEQKTITTDIVPAGVRKETRQNESHFLGGEDAYHRIENTSKLVLIGEYPISGTITSLARVKALNTKSGGDALLVASKDAKLSLVEWDPENYRISTISIHYYEGDNIQTAPFGPDLSECENYLAVDPSSRCAALKFGVKNLAILPFRQSGDELVAGDYDPDLDSPPPAKVKEFQAQDAGAVKETPYSSSFVLPLTAIDPALTHPVHLAFLHEYREPTFGIISSGQAVSSALLDERKDILTYSVFTLDLEQKASTTLLSITGLPFDIFRIMPLPLPVGGALLVGCNELIHVDQAGKTNAVGVNEFARQISAFSMADQSDLSLRLEDCVIHALDTSSADMLIVLNTGELAVLSFRLDGRSVSGLSVHLVDAAHGGQLVRSAASCMASVGRGKLFVGSEDGDSTLLGWTRNTAQLSRKRSHAQMIAEDADVSLDEDDMDDEEEDDLYGDDSEAIKRTTLAPSRASAPGDYAFRIHDVIPSLGPINSVCLGKGTTHSSDKPATNEQDVAAPLSIIVSVNRNQSSTLALLNREITPHVLSANENTTAQGVWTVCAKHSAPQGLPKAEDGNENPEAQLAPDNQYDQYLIIYNYAEGEEDRSRIYKLDNAVQEKKNAGAKEPVELSDTEFEGEGETVNMGTLAAGTRIIQVKKNEVRSYDADLGLSQIFPIIDEDTDAELKVIHSTFCDPYLLLIRDDYSIQILETDKNGELDEVERTDALLSSRWLSGCVYKSEVTGGKALLFLLTAEGGLVVFDLADVKQPVYVAPTLSAVPPVLSTEAASRRPGTRETLTELLFNDLGDSSYKTPYLIIRSSTDDLTLYEPFHYPASSSFTTNLKFRKVPGMHVPRYNEDFTPEKPSPLRALRSVNGYETVFMAGAAPCFVLKEAASLPRILPLRGKGVRGLSGLNKRGCEGGFTYVDTSGVLRDCQLPSGTRYGDIGWTVKKFSPLDDTHEIQDVRYHSAREMYVISSKQRVDFYFPEEDSKAAADEDIHMRPQAAQYHLHLYDPHSNAIIHGFALPPNEQLTSLECMPLEISDVTHQHKHLIAAGTLLQRGEGFPARGTVYVFDIIDVVPEPDRPETGKCFHVVSREETKGAITAITGVAGLIGTAQGQKIMFRGLKEDGSCLPVAFLDAQCYITSMKSLGSSGLWLAADAWKGVWFCGFNEEPYKLTLFGKSRSKMEVVAADFLPSDGQLYIAVVDAHCDMHILQYDPEHPKSLSGQRLVHRSTFHLGHLPTSMTLLPSTLAPFAAQPTATDEDGVEAEGEEADGSEAGGDKANGNAPISSASPFLHHILLTSRSGSLGLLTPLDESTYRRLSALQTHLTSILEHAAGLNPRAYRAVETEGLGARGVVDGDLVVRVGELGAAKRAEVVGRAGGEVWALRSDLEVLGGAGLGYL